MPGRRSPSSGFDVSIDVSVMPYRSRITWPVRRRNSSCVEASNGAEPEMNTRIDRQCSASRRSSASRRV